MLHKSRIHHFEREGNAVRTILWEEIEFTPRKTGREHGSGS